MPPLCSLPEVSCSAISPSNPPLDFHQPQYSPSPSILENTHIVGDGANNTSLWRTILRVLDMAGIGWRSILAINKMIPIGEFPPRLIPKAIRPCCNIRHIRRGGVLEQGLHLLNRAGKEIRLRQQRDSLVAKLAPCGDGDCKEGKVGERELHCAGLLRLKLG